jgi:hypothetical protein
MMKGSDMQTSLEVDGLLTTPQPLTAANEEFARQQQQPSSPAGWDPFEVWRTRVKAAAQDSTKPANSIA